MKSTIFADRHGINIFLDFAESEKVQIDEKSKKTQTEEQAR
jgi:hypothetical protein